MIKRLEDQLTRKGEELDTLWKRFDVLQKEKENTEHQMQELRVTMAKYEASMHARCHDRSIAMIASYYSVGV